MPRIVSMIASATEIVDALGMTDYLVARSHECDYPERVRALPVCTRPRIDVTAGSREIDRAVKESARTSIYDVLDDALERAAPTHIVTQIQCEVCAVSLRDVEHALSRGLKTRPEIVALQPDSLEQIWEDIHRVARALDIAERGEALIMRKKAEMNALTGACAKSHVRVACIEWIEPLMAAGNWTPELIEMAGAVNLFGEAGKHSPWMTWDELKASAPDVILIAPCGFDLARTEAEMHWLTQRPDWGDLRAVREGRVYLADGNQYFNRPGPRVVETLGIIAQILRFDCNQGIGWRRFGTAI